jgi:hypothetical protein
MEKTVILHEIVSAAQRPGFVSSAEKKRALGNMQCCRTYDRGGRIMYCQNCKTTSVLYNPCNQRGCPTCYEKNQIIWKMKLQRRILPVSHEHIVFSFPQDTTKLWLVHRAKVISALFRIASQAIKDLQEETGLVFGCVLVFQSHGKGMSYKPHIHCLLSSGGMNESKQWIANGSIPYRILEDSVKRVFLSEIGKSIPGFETQVTAKGFQSSDCRIYHAHHANSGADIVGYLSQSLAGVVIDMNQQFVINDEKDQIRFKESHKGEEIETTLSKELFAERYLNHIPPSGCVTVRYYGLYSNSRAEDLEQIKSTVKALKPKDTADIVKGDICPECQSVLIMLQILQPGKKGGILVNMIARSPPPHGALISRL